MSNLTYSIAIDSANDGSFTDDSISQDVLALRWQLGMTAPYAQVSESFAEVVLLNREGQYHDLELGQRLRIQTTYRFTTETRFTGWIERITTQTGTQGAKTSTLYLRGRETEIAQNHLTLPLILNTRADEALTLLLQAATLRRDAFVGYCLIDIAPYNDIGDEPLIYPENALTMDFETGKSTFAYLGDTWSGQMNALDIIRDLMLGEGGRFFIDGEGTAVFHNRHHNFIDLITPLSFSDEMTGLDYQYGTECLNQVEVRFRPRSVGAENSLLWSLTERLKLERGAIRQLSAPYTLEALPVGALALIAPVPEVHYHAHDGLGVDMSSQIEVILVEQGGRAAILEIRNLTRTTIFLTDLELRGTPLILGDVLSLTEADSASISLYGLRQQALTVNTLTDLEEAAALAKTELLLHSTPRASIRSIRLTNRLHPDQVHEQKLFDVIQIQETYTGHDGLYRIVGETHQVSKGGSLHETEWLVEVDERDSFVIVGYSSVNDGTLLLPR